MKVYTNKPNKIDEKILTQALKKTDNDVKNVCVGIKFVSRWKIKSLNQKHRGVDNVTDVLSFPLLQTTRFHTLQNFDDERDPLTKELEIGDIVICLSKAKAQAKKYGHSLDRELNFLALHGFLHLLGFDHLTTKDDEQMSKITEDILQAAGHKRGE